MANNRLDFTSPAVLGRTGLSVSRLGIGSSYGVPASAIEKAFHEHRINFFYWGALRRKGMRNAIRNLSAQHRSQFVVALQSYDRSGKLMRFMFERGLKALRLDQADVLILGWHNRQPHPRIVDAALSLQKRGLVKHLALSGHNRKLFPRLFGAESNFDAAMIRYNAAHRGAETEVFPDIPRESRPGIIAFTATRWGHLLKSKKLPPEQPPLTAAECYRFALSHPAVDICMTGPANAAQLEEAVTALAEGPLDAESLVRARRIGDLVHG